MAAGVDVARVGRRRPVPVPTPPPVATRGLKATVEPPATAVGGRGRAAPAPGPVVIVVVDAKEALAAADADATGGGRTLLAGAGPAGVERAARVVARPDGVTGFGAPQRAFAHQAVKATATVVSAVGVAVARGAITVAEAAQLRRGSAEPCALGGPRATTAPHAAAVGRGRRPGPVAPADMATTA